MAARWGTEPHVRDTVRAFGYRCFDDALIGWQVGHHNGISIVI